MSQLQSFAVRALRQVPAPLWWVLAALLSAVLSIALEKEVFPNTPAAVRLARRAAFGCVLALPPLGVVWLWRVAAVVEHSGWRVLWQLGAATATGLGLLLLLVLLVVGVAMWR